MPSNRIFSVVCPLGNNIHLTHRTWQGHTIPKHDAQDHVGDLESVRATVENPDHIRYSTDEHHGQDTGVYERIITGTTMLMRVPVLFDSPEFVHGGQEGRIMTAFVPFPPSGGNIGKIFWMADRKKEGKK